MICPSFAVTPIGKSYLMKITSRFRLIVFVKIVLCLAAVDLFGDEPNSSPAPVLPDGVTVDTKDLKGVALKTPGMAIREDVSLSYSYVGDADLKSGGSGHMGEMTSQFGYGLKVPLNDTVSLQWGVNYNRLDFGQPSGSPLPDNLATISTTFGAEYKVSDEWKVFGAVIPRLELIDNFDQVESSDFQLGGAVGATYEPNANLSVRMGFVINPGSIGTPVLPILGLRWKFADQWTLNFGFPRTAIDYQLLPNLRLSPLELSFNGGSYHTSKTYGNSVGDPDLNDRQLDYNEVRVGTGAEYAVMKNVHVGLTAGAVVYREFDFRDAGFKPKVDPAPYVQLGVRMGF